MYVSIYLVTNHSTTRSKLYGTKGSCSIDIYMQLTLHMYIHILDIYPIKYCIFRPIAIAR